MKKRANRHEYAFKFTIIMSIYNTEQWLEEAVDSVISQDIGFKENVQIVFVNDGSPDDSEAICLRYKEEYPDNIVYIKKENGGLSSARNAGLKYREGEYINFFDPDDILTDNVLSEVWDFYSQNPTVALVAVPLVFFEAERGLHSKYKYLGNENRVIDLREEPHNFILSSASAFYKTEVFDTLSYNEKMHGEEDTMLNFQLYADNPTLGYVCENKVIYRYRRRASANSMVDSAKFTPVAFQTALYLLDEVLKIGQNIDEAYQELVIYEIRSRLKNIYPEIFSHTAEYEAIIKGYRKHIANVDKKRLIKQTPFITTKAQRHVFLTNIFEQQPYGVGKAGFVCADGLRLYPLANINVFVKDIALDDGGLVVDVVWHDYDIPGIGLTMQTKDGNPAEVIERQELNSTYDVMYGKFVASKTIHYRFKVKYTGEKRAFRFYVHDSTHGKRYRAARVRMYSESPFVLEKRFTRLFDGKMQIKYTEGTFVIAPRQTSLLRYNITSTAKLWVRSGFKVLPLMRLFSRPNKKYILLNDRPIAAGDNAEALFEYINKHHEDVASDTFFVLDRKSPDFSRLRKIGNVVAHGSIKHRFLQVNARFIVSSHLHPLFKSAWSLGRLRYYSDLMNSKFVWLQHGVTKDSIEKAASRLHRHVAAVVVAAHHEEKEFMRPQYFYKKGQVLSTGFPRYDKLTDRSENIITVMPTWRNYLTGRVLKSGLHDKFDGFRESQYFKEYSEFLSNYKLKALLKSNDLKLRFMLHPGMSQYIEDFMEFAGENIEIVPVGSIGYDEVFATSKMLITDWSSVFFDFAYLDKPVIFFQFDKEDFRSGHYKDGIFNYETMGLGPIVETVDQLTSQLEKSIKNGCSTPPMYKKRANDLYIHRDQNNSKRVYEAILALDK